MSILTKLHVNESVLNILKYRLSVTQNADYTGRPSSKAVVQPIEITYETIKNDPFYEKMVSGKMTDSLKLVLAPVQMNSKTTTMELLDFYVLEQQENFDGVNSNPMTTFVKISFASLVVNGVVMDVKYWREHDPRVKTAAPTVIREEDREKEPKIKKIDWIDGNSKEQIKETEYDKKLGLRVEIKNANGGTVTIVIKKEDGTAFENGNLEFNFIEPVNEDGIVEIEPFLVERVWEDNKVQTYDYLVATVSYDNKTKDSKEIKIIPFPQIVVDFRPSDKYAGEYGFDYLRDKSGKKDRVTYKKIMGTNKDNSSGNNVFTKYPTDAKFNALKNTHYPLTDKDGNIIKLDWYKNFEGNPLEYTQSHLTIYPKKSVILSLQIESIENPKELTFNYNKDYFTLSTETIPAQRKNKKRLKDFLTITCKKEFSKDQQIKVLYKDRLLGQLNVLKNDKANRKKVKVVFVQVKTEIVTGSLRKGKFTTSGKPEKDMLERLLKQAYIKLELEEFLAFNPTAIIDPTTNKPKYPNFNTDYTLKDLEANKIINKYKKGTKTNINYFMEDAFNDAHPKYIDYVKIFFFGDIGGRKDDAKQIVQLGGFAKKIKSKSVSVFKERESTDVTHEVLHAIGLYHSFKNKDYDFKKGATKNIMDYSTNKNHLWLWQLKQLWANTQILKE